MFLNACKNCEAKSGEEHIRKEWRDRGYKKVGKQKQGEKWEEDVN